MFVFSSLYICTWNYTTALPNVVWCGVVQKYKYFLYSQYFLTGFLLKLIFLNI